jgi:thiamine kinase-like enzyme
MSKDMNKIKEEYEYYYLLPEGIQRFFIQPFGFTMQGEVAFYHMEQSHARDMGTRSANKELSEAEFSDFLRKIAIVKKLMPDEPVLDSQVDKNAKDLVLEKTKKRLQELKNSDWYMSEYAMRIETSEDSIDNLYKELEKKFTELYSKRTYKRITLSHGDMTFSNILWDRETDYLKFIDPKGSSSMYMDEYYDLAKLSQSVNGCYDEIIHENYSINMSNMELFIDGGLSPRSTQEFKHYVESNNINYKLLRVYEASLFLSMTPHHIEDHKRVAAFILNAARILKKIK